MKTVMAWIGLAVSVAFIIIAVIGLMGCQAQTSFTPPPACPAGQHAVRAHSYQGKVWECAR